MLDLTEYAHKVCLFLVQKVRLLIFLNIIFRIKASALANMLIFQLGLSSKDPLPSVYILVVDTESGKV